MSSKKVKITDVAKQAEVSVSTVSLVLSNKGRISEATIKKVNKAIEELGYVRNEAAANLRSKRSNLIGLVLRDIADPFYAEITAGISEELEAKGYMLFLAQSGDSSEKLQKCVQSMIQQGVAGIVINPIRNATQSVVDMVQKANVPAVCVSRASVIDDIDQVCPDNNQAAKLATQHLIDQGHRHIAYVGGVSNSLTRAERIGGYCTTLMQYGLLFKNEWVVECDNSHQSAAKVTQELLNKNPKITAILCHYPVTALGAIYGVQRANRSVGKDNYIGQQVSIIGFDDVPEAELSMPALTFTSSSAKDIGKLTGQRMLVRMENPDGLAEKVIVPPKLIKRDSA